MFIPFLKKMSEIQLTVNSRSLERFFFIIVILVLASLNFIQWNHDTGDAVTAQVTADTELQGVEDTDVPETQTDADLVAGTCTDGIKNQDETQVDCGGTCSGYWYDNDCNSEPKEADDDIECRMNSDCDSGYTCEDNACVEIPPECEEDSDCQYNEECTADFKCEEKRLSGLLEAKILTVDVAAGVGENTKKVKAVKLEIENGKGKTMVLYGKAYIYEDRSDPMYDVAQGGEFEIGSVKTGETVSQFFTIKGVSFPDDDESREIRIVIFDDDDEEVDTVKTTAYP